VKESFPDNWEFDVSSRADLCFADPGDDVSANAFWEPQHLRQVARNASRREGGLVPAGLKNDHRALPPPSAFFGRLALRRDHRPAEIPHGK